MAKTNEKTADTDQKMPVHMKAEEPKFCISSLREHCVQLFDVSTSTFDGAMYGHSEKELTINKARAIIEGWLKK